jgi:hypothetical protein
MNRSLWRMVRRGFGLGLTRHQFGLVAAEEAGVADSVAAVATELVCRRTLAAIAASFPDARGAKPAADQRYKKGS